MMRRQMVLALVSTVLLAALPAAAADDARSGIEAANKLLEAAVSRGDGAGAAALYTADGQAFPAHSDLVSGTEALAAFWQAAFDSGMKAASLVTVEVESFGSTAYEVGTFEFRDAAGKLLDQGKYVVIWKKEGDSWKLHRDIWTTSVAQAKQ